MLAERLNRKHLYLPGSFDYREIKEELRKLLQELQAGQEQENVLGIETISEELEAFCKREITLCENAVGHAKAIIGDTSIVLDYLYHPRPLGLAGFLQDIGHAFDRHILQISIEKIFFFYNHKGKTFSRTW